MLNATNKPKVLLLAEEANPEWVSVPLLGWSMSQALREVAEVHLVTQVRNLEAIRRKGLQEGEDFTVIDSERLAAPLGRISRMVRGGETQNWTTNTAFQVLTYPYFEHLVWKAFGTRIRLGEFDLVHRVTPVSLPVFSPIAAKCRAVDTPFIIGPINGGVPWPEGFNHLRRQEREWPSFVRDLYKLIPGRKRSLASSAAILVGSRITEAGIEDRFRDKTIYLPENAIDPHYFNARSEQRLDAPIRACFVGRLAPLKGVDMLLDAAAPFLRDGTLTLDIVGEGPLRQDLEALASDNGSTEAVTFHGNVPHASVQDILGKANLMVFPSIREFGGGVVLEAMALGVVPVVVDYGGPGDLVNNETGFKIRLGSRDDVVRDLTSVLQGIVAHPDQLGCIGATAARYVRDNFTWSEKAKQIRQIYDWVLGEQANKPDFFET